MSFAWEFLEKSYHENRLVHAYLFFGGDSHQMNQIAREFAKLIMDADEVVSNLIDQSEHANVINISPDGKNIKKEQITFLKTEITKKSLENKAKIYIIDSAHQMSISATNSLLKFLEEPAPDVHIILIAPAKELLLDTIISRCVALNFSGTTTMDESINPEYERIITQLTQGESLQILVAQNNDLLKDDPESFLVALAITYRKKMEQSLTIPSDLKRNLRILRAIEDAQQGLRYSMNVALCFDRLAAQF